MRKTSLVLAVLLAVAGIYVMLWPVFTGNRLQSSAATAVQEFLAERIGIEDGQIVAAYIMNHDCDEAYHTVRWLTDAEDKEMVVLHALRVLPEYGGRGYSKQLVQHAIDTARERGLKSIRLDCIEGNDIPQKMYMSFGFAYVDTVEITYVDIGIPRKFLLYEFAL